MMKEENNPPRLQKIPVWDLPVRLFHWILVLLIVGLWATTEEDVYYDMTLHTYLGYSVLALVLFRILWGFVGSKHARFSDFIYGIPATLAYLKHLPSRQPSAYIGHNPVGGWSVIFLLLALLVQTGTGLFADDDIFTTGAFAKFVSSDTSHFLTEVHEINFNILMLLVGLHIAAILFYRFYKRVNLVKPMIVGTKEVSPEQALTAKKFASAWLALFLLGLTGSGVYLAVFIWAK
ncbi:cytochrome b/b6 domain-containing protein [Beggiatoa leptomitoformis]|uniref:Hydrogenase n=1 Tax=Beggiatoa leptomitoformis TaxID=288004 RepID=A0A2N9YAR7_9GAMM|nr:cytochrome b/b6 domain-containing protein [Beggiatoa leptomitoformis]ALG67072.1 hydrogenase [Beggiatoa leptomitoformis]AUI67539.1 hydrogenase [Beggiatoa leptomitoformis]